MIHLVQLSFLLIFMSGCASVKHAPLHNQGKKMTKRSINQIGEAYFEYSLKRDPLYATYIGDHRFDDRLPDITEQARINHHQQLQNFRAELAAFNINELNDGDRIRYDLLLHELNTQIDIATCQFPLWTVDQLEGPQIAFAELPKNHGQQELIDLENLIRRYSKAYQFFLDHVENLRNGRNQGFVAAKINIEHVIEQLEQQLKEDIVDSPFMVKINQMPKSWPSKQKRELLSQIENEIAKSLYPGLSLYRDYLKYELLPDARTMVGINALPSGDVCYQHLIERHTGLKKTPGEIHEEGIREVFRIKEEMQKLIRAKTDVHDEKTYISSLKNDRTQFLATPEDLIAHNQQLVQRAQDALPKAFGKLPKTKIVVIPLEVYRHKHAPVAYYYEAPANGERPAYYYLNTYRPHTRPLYNMAALAFHEAVPGHHLQIALANENKTIPAFQRHLGQTAFVEGWALYAEILSRELALYQSVAELFGSLNYELWRAIRLVVDTGIHAKGWTREEAAQYLLEHTALTKDEVINEIDRYIVWPAQALAYKVGQMEISNLRKTSEEVLGASFSLKNFHDQILKNGAMPMATLRHATLRWLDAEKANKKVGKK